MWKDLRVWLHADANRHEFCLRFTKASVLRKPRVTLSDYAHDRRVTLSPTCDERRIDSMHIVYDTHPLRERVGDKYVPSPVLSG